MTLLTFLTVLAIGGLLGRLVLQLVPVYLNNARLVASLEGLKSQPDWATWSREEILDALRKRWDVDSVDHVTSRQVSIGRELGTTRVRVAYDVVQPFFGNIDLLVRFDETIEDRRR